MDLHEIAERCEIASQALANSRLDGYEPTELDMTISVVWATGRFDSGEQIQLYKSPMQQQLTQRRRRKLFVDAQLKLIQCSPTCL